MGNCLKGQAADDESLLRGNIGERESSSSDQFPFADPYSVRPTMAVFILLYDMTSACIHQIYLQGPGFGCAYFN